MIILGMDMDRPTAQQPIFQVDNDLSFLPSPGIHRAKTSLRLRYESEARVILKNLGGLEGVRARLALSQRKLAQLLLVDPSAWSRWLKDESKIPPHVVKALQWYLLLEDKDPSWQQWRELIHKRDPDPGWNRWRREMETKLKIPPAAQPEVKGQIEDLKETHQRLAGELERRVILGLGWKLLLILNSFAVVYWVIRAVF